MDTQPKLDKFQKLVSDSQYAVAILGNSSLDSFELVNLEAVSTHVAADLATRGMGFVGVIGVVNGWPRTALDTPLDAETVHALARAFLQNIEAEIESVADLERLYQLPDTRN